MYDDFKEELKDAYAEIDRLRRALEDLMPFVEYQLSDMLRLQNPEPLRKAIKAAKLVLEED